MFIPADIFLKVGGHNWDFNNANDISKAHSSGNYACEALGGDEQGCGDCPLYLADTCATEFAYNLDLKDSIAAFKLSHPEYFL